MADQLKPTHSIDYGETLSDHNGTEHRFLTMTCTCGKTCSIEVFGLDKRDEQFALLKQAGQGHLEGRDGG